MLHLQRKNFCFLFDNNSQQNNETDLDETLDYHVPKCIAVTNWCISEKWKSALDVLAVS